VLSQLPASSLLLSLSAIDPLASLFAVKDETRGLNVDKRVGTGTGHLLRITRVPLTSRLRRSHHFIFQFKHSLENFTQGFFAC